MLIEASPPPTSESMHSTNNNESVKRWVDKRANFVSIILFSLWGSWGSLFFKHCVFQRCHTEINNCLPHALRKPAAWKQNWTNKQKGSISKNHPLVWSFVCLYVWNWKSEEILVHNRKIWWLWFIPGARCIETFRRLLAFSTSTVSLPVRDW